MKLRHAIDIFLLIIIQLLISTYFDFFKVVEFNIIPIIILSISCKRTSIQLMLTGFIIGIILDILGGGVLGINAASLVLLAFVRRVLLKNIAKSNILSRIQSPTINELGFTSYFVYILSSYLIFFIAYMSLLGDGLISWTFIASVLGNTLLAYIAGLLFNNRL